MKRLYIMSGLIISILTLIIMLIATVNEDITNRAVVSVIFPVIAFGLSFPCSLISRQIMKVGDMIRNKILKVLYFIAVPVVSLAVFAAVAMLLGSIDTSAEDFSTTLGRGLMVLFLQTAVFIGMIMPSVQTFIVMILRKFLKRWE